MIPKNKNIIPLILLSIFFLCNCNNENIIFDGLQIKSTKISVNEVKDDRYFTTIFDTLHKDLLLDTLEIFKTNHCEVILPKNYLMNNSFLNLHEREVSDQSLIIKDNYSNLILHDSVCISSHSTCLFETANFYYMTYFESGHIYIYNYEQKNYKLGLLIISKRLIPEVKILFLTNYYPVSIIEDNNILRIKVQKFKPEFSWLNKILHDLVVHHQLGEFVSTNQYEELKIDTNLNVIFRREYFK